MRICSSCGEEKSDHKFLPNKSKPKGITYICRPCSRKIEARRLRIVRGFAKEYPELFETFKNNYKE